MKPFGIISDTHNHGWSAFATTLATGVNSRLQMTLNETARCAAEVKKAGGSTMYHGGDLFHVRGSVAPSVLNPTLDCYRAIIESGVDIVINAGNHDLEGKEATRIGSAITALEGVGCTVINQPGIHRIGAGSDMMIVPWVQNLADLKLLIEVTTAAERADMDLLLHAPIDGVIPGLPNHGLNAAYLSGLGYRHVFAGHYHHHKDLGGKVYSIGSLTPQTWSDVGAKAGFLIVSDSGVRRHASHAPSFVEIDGSVDPADVPMLVDGNYARAKIGSAKSSDVEAMRCFLTDSGALGVVVLSTPAVSAPTRGGGVTSAAPSTVEASVTSFIATQGFANPAPLSALCMDILTTVRSAA